MFDICEDCYLRDVKLNKDSKNSYSLDLTYEGKDKHGNIHERVLNGVPLPLYSNTRYIEMEQDIGYCSSEKRIDVGYGMILLTSDVKVADVIVEYATKEMTLEEIEKQLGHKVKIVKEKEKEND